VDESKLQLRTISAKKGEMKAHTKSDAITPPVLLNNSLIDTHCHLDMTTFTDDLDHVLERAFSTYLKRIVTIGIDLPSSQKAISLASSHKRVSATIGIHPHDTEHLQNRDYLALEKLYVDHRETVVGFGEIGLDYYKQHSDPAKQRHHFNRQLALAHELGLPIIVHNRAADDDIIEILRQAKPLDYGGIMHCFSGDSTFARKILDLGMLISIPGIVTFKNSISLQEVARNIPLTSMVLETDGPFLAPQPFRGKRNEPSYLEFTARKVAEIRRIDVNLVAAQTTANAEKLFSFTKQ
jgi:TatD DNase family protein